LIDLFSFINHKFHSAGKRIDYTSVFNHENCRENEKQFFFLVFFFIPGLHVPLQSIMGFFFVHPIIKKNKNDEN
jgi:hypothetical protein